MIGLVQRARGGRAWFVVRRGGDAIGAHPRLSWVESHARYAAAVIVEHAPISCTCASPWYERVALIVDDEQLAWRGAICLACQVITHGLWCPDECHGDHVAHALD